MSDNTCIHHTDAERAWAAKECPVCNAYSATKIATLESQFQQAHAECARLKKGVEHWKENYRTELESADKQIKFCEEHLDTHGVNFHQGRRGALVSSDIALTPLRDLLNTSILGQDLIAELGRVKELLETERRDRAEQSRKDYDNFQRAHHKIMEHNRQLLELCVQSANLKNPLPIMIFKESAACLQGKVDGWVSVKELSEHWETLTGTPQGTQKHADAFVAISALLANAQKDGQ